MSAILPGHGLPPTGLGGINLQPQGNVQVPQGQQQAPQGVGPARQGAGALAGRQIQVGDGQPRDTSLGLADKAKAAISLTQVQMSQCVVKAPFSGHVVKLQAQLQPRAVAALF